MPSVDLTPLFLQLANPVAQLVLAGLALAAGAWGVWLLRRYIAPIIGPEREAKAEAQLQRALDEGVARAMEFVEAWEAEHSKVEVKSRVGAWAAQFAIDRAHTAVKKLGLDPEDVAQRALARIPMPELQVATIQGQEPAVVVASLPPVAPNG